MKPIIVARKFNVTDDIRARINKKLKKFDKFFPEETETTITLFEKRGRETVEITFFRNGTIFRAEETDKDVICALDKAVDVLERQIIKNRTRLEKKIHIVKEIPIPVTDEPEEEIKITKHKKFEILPMSVEEAVMQMNLLSHTFYMFRNTDSGVINLVYKRKNDEYGIIEPTE
ncbi:MAG: ribosomal subunit interface protein [Clostridiales bacterium GWF2_38_85]|nr:MAG: ribosomal subunit interface protein [Clostridiales bacterium GWF2_38_85]HBL83906.1 ribosome-associated translation inhibitor RaiA [Clostridiales bacterium]